MKVEEVKKRFLEEIKLRSFDDHYVDPKEEREILQMAAIQEWEVESAFQVLAEVCRSTKTVLASQVRRHLKDFLDHAAATQGKISEAGFYEAVEQCQKISQGKIKGVPANKLVLNILEHQGYSIEEGWMIRWFQDLKKDLVEKGE